MSEKQSTPGAVFLSYAREDSDAARRIADALRAFGLEVWFDQSELRGGDTWDAKIKSQIRTCALFRGVHRELPENVLDPPAIALVSHGHRPRRGVRGSPR